MDVALAVSAALVALGGSTILAVGVFRLSRAWRARNSLAAWEGLTLGTAGGALVSHSPWLLAAGAVVLAMSIRLKGAEASGEPPALQPPPP
ncbi:hypothetical protein [Streptomyces californicus]|uniref:hypothetical protein n=1 Tax=Streptomyces californicus TaxID=67351 RepID=UPI00371A4FF1